MRRATDREPLGALGWAGAISAAALRLVLGGAFVFAGWVKLEDVQQFALSLGKYELIPLDTAWGEHLARTAALTLPWAELLAGVLLIAGLAGRGAALLIAAMLLAFTLANMNVVAQGLEIECGCFGDLSWPCAGPIGACHILRNVALLAMAVVLTSAGTGPLGLDRLPPPRFFRPEDGWTSAGFPEPRGRVGPGGSDDGGG